MAPPPLCAPMPGPMRRSPGTGLRCWWDARTRCLFTETPGLFVHRWFGVWGSGYASALILHQGGRAIACGRPGGGPFFSEILRDEPRGVLVATMGALGFSLRIPNPEATREIPREARSLPLSNAAGFAGAEEQAQGLALIREAMAAAWGATPGEEAAAPGTPLRAERTLSGLPLEVRFSDPLSAAIEAGTCIDPDPASCRPAWRGPHGWEGPVAPPPDRRPDPAS